MLWFETNMRQCCLWAFVLALTLFGAATTRANDGCTQCEGCPYHVDGQCITNPAQFGYYRTNWRRWPGDFPLAEPRVRQVPATVPDVELPEPIFEDESIPRPQRQSNTYSSSPEAPNQDQDGAPALPGELQRDDWQTDPFQDDPVPDIPGIQDDLLDDLGEPQASAAGRGTGSQNRRTLANRPDSRRPGQPRHRRNAASRPANLAGPLGSTSAVVPASAAIPLPVDGTVQQGNKNPLRNIQKLTAQASVSKKRNRGNPLR